MNRIKEGAVVQLKSGGPKMTVREIASSGGFICVWFDGTKLQRDVFRPETLLIIEEEQEKKK